MLTLLSGTLSNDVHRTIQIAVSDLPNLKFTKEDNLKFLRCIMMLTGCVNAVMMVNNKSIVEETLIPILNDSQ